MSKFTKFLRNPGAFFRDAKLKKEFQAGALRSKGIPTLAFYFSDWKRDFYRMVFPERSFHFLSIKTSAEHFQNVWLPFLNKHPQTEFFIWGMNEPEYLHSLLNKKYFIEDGFVRSVALGAQHAHPYSITVDSKTPYFNATRSSDLEVLLSEYDFGGNPELIERSRTLIRRILELNISKYNQGSSVGIEALYGPKKGKRILVLGQVEEDASIKFGCAQTFTNSDLISLAHSENPGAQIIYKPHPDVLKKLRKQLSDPRSVANLCQILDSDISLSQSFETIDHVYTITSLAGFEALMRGIKVTTVGCPFYSGWGLTDERQKNERRTRQLSVEQVFAAAYILYPKYFDADSGRPIEPEEAVEIIARKVAAQANDAAFGAESLLLKRKPLEAETMAAVNLPLAAVDDNFHIRTAAALRAHPAVLARAIIRLRQNPDDSEIVQLVGASMRELGFEREARELFKVSRKTSEKERFGWIRSFAGLTSKERVATCREAHRLYPRSARMISELAKALTDNLQYDEALSLLQNSIKESPESRSLYRALAQHYQQTGAWVKWRETVEDNVRRFPQSEIIVADLVKCLIELGFSAEADQIIHREQLNVETDTSIRRVVARRFFFERKLDRAVALAREICASENANHGDEFILVLWLFAAGKFTEAFDHLRVHSNRFPGVFRFSAKIAQAMERMEQYTDALDAWKRAHFAHPTNPASLAGIVRCHAFLNQPKQLDEWLDLFPKGGLMPVKKGFLQSWALWRRGDTARAKEVFLEARKVLRDYTAELERHFDESPDLVLFENEWRKHPNPLYVDSQKHFWDFVRRIRRGKVVIVGNSPCILNSKLGPAIDSHDEVIRLNDFSIEGFESDVGSKVTLWYSSAHRFAQTKSRNLTGFEIILYHPKAQHFPCIEDFARARLGLEGIHEERAYYLPTPLYELMEDVLYPDPTTGLRIILLLLSVVDAPINLAGFDFFVETSNHYYEGDKKRLPVGEVHATSFEHEFVLGLLQEVEAVKLL